ncbi:hypothetical protein [Persicitalea jodogahamensis]|uniref:Uncharacterized protein n=1 Tax=Persicitalea jodogahamensis TaxID=402147 RepID=A0A8J3D7N1_9BACT|nr:hypothetical protein [Persicitalea jodogahamensis]GHB86272.1 hypothetical protein GCM10007390_47200 [Persicitalea jodogahamensis]
MMSQGVTVNTRPKHFIIFVAVNLAGYLFIPYAVGYAHSYLNGVFIPNSLRWDQAGGLRADRTGWYLAQLSIAGIEWLGLLWLLYRFNRSNASVWLDQRPELARLVALPTTGIICMLTLFARDSFLLWLIKRTIHAAL